MAFSKPVSTHIKQTNEKNSIPIRSKSAKSLSKFKEQQPSNIPFAIALKTGLMSASKKQSLH